MKLEEVKRNLKRDPTASISVRIHRKAGIYITWILLNIFPGLSPDAVTLSMLALNITATVFLYFAVLKTDYLCLLSAFVIYNVSEFLDCVDGNVARIKKHTSIMGVFLDRLVHNISSPLFFITAGFAIYFATGYISYLIILMAAGIFIELSPVRAAFKDVETSFVRQLIYRKTLNFDIDKYSDCPVKDSDESREIRISKLKVFAEYTIKAVSPCNVLMAAILIDWLAMRGLFLLTALLASAIIIARIVPLVSVKKWAAELYRELKKIKDQLI